MAARAILVWRNLYLLNAQVRDALNARLIADAGCSLLEHDLMSWLAAAPDRRLRMLDLARRLRMSPGGLTRVTDRLVERGWVSRESPADNRREVYATLTASGAASLKTARSSYTRVLRQTLAAHLDESDLEILQAITDKVLNGLGTERQWRPDGQESS